MKMPVPVLSIFVSFPLPIGAMYVQMLAYVMFMIHTKFSYIVTLLTIATVTMFYNILVDHSVKHGNLLCSVETLK